MRTIAICAFSALLGAISPVAQEKAVEIRLHNGGVLEYDFNNDVSVSCLYDEKNVAWCSIDNSEIVIVPSDTKLIHRVGPKP